MAKVISNSNIVCLPSTYGEGIPKTLLEGSSCGRAIIAYDTPGCNDIIINGYNGYLVEPKNIDQLAKKITHLVKNKTICEKLGQNGRKMMEEKFSSEIIAKKTIELWEKSRENV